MTCGWCVFRLQCRLVKNISRVHFLFVFSLFLSSASLVAASDFTGQVVGVVDGDTIEDPHNQHAQRIRLSGIDCPEKGQAYLSSRFPVEP